MEVSRSLRPWGRGGVRLLGLGPSLEKGRFEGADGGFTGALETCMAPGRARPCGGQPRRNSHRTFVFIQCSPPGACRARCGGAPPANLYPFNPRCSSEAGESSAYSRPCSGCAGRWNGIFRAGLDTSSFPLSPPGSLRSWNAGRASAGLPGFISLITPVFTKNLPGNWASLNTEVSFHLQGSWVMSSGRFPLPRQGS